MMVRQLRRDRRNKPGSRASAIHDPYVSPTLEQQTLPDPRHPRFLRSSSYLVAPGCFLLGRIRKTAHPPGIYLRLPDPRQSLAHVFCGNQVFDRNQFLIHFDFTLPFGKQRHLLPLQSFQSQWGPIGCEWPRSGWMLSRPPLSSGLTYPPLSPPTGGFPLHSQSSPPGREGGFVRSQSGSLEVPVH
jgi:hypothetical protein